ncbi:PDGLE domain-containing protein [Cumulibacter manganitolerans]|uniref:PDGLE domain-containing protein n=1 Tax=Cumulibacter manganitolerans TaxID=1884992 RepID=UPI001E59AA17|nr:PDGLE domain-containing protein [Cumulibacter manganitolerans]
MTARPRTARAVAIGLLVAAVLMAGLLSYFASSAPDGLEKVAGDKGISDAARPHASEDGPLAHYRTKGVDDRGLSGGVAGVLGVVAVGAAGTGLFLLLRPRRPVEAAADAAAGRHADGR